MNCCWTKIKTGRILHEIWLWIFHHWLDTGVSLRKWPMSGLQEAGAALRVDLLHRGLVEVSDFFSYTNFLILQHLCVSCSVALGWLSFFYPAGGGEGTSSGFWAPGQRLQAQSGAVCWDICTEQTRGMRRDKLFTHCRLFSIHSIKTSPPSLKYGLFSPLCQSVSPEMCVEFIQKVFLPLGIDDLQQSLSHFFNTSSCQTKSQCHLSLIALCSIRAFDLWN